MRTGDVDGLGTGLRRGVALAAAILALACFPAAAQAATQLFPNLKTLPPRDLRFDRANVDPDGGSVMHNVLRFTNTVWNSGPGRLEMRGTIDSKTDEGGAVQRVYDDAGGFSDYAAGEFYYHPEHDHYHYDEWGRYELWTKTGYEAWLASGRTEGSPVLGSKTTSCMIDEEFIRSVPNQPYPPEYGTGGCFPDSKGRMLQGISPGWGDTYDYFRFEQWIDLGASGTLADGQYVLRSVADPVNKIYESAGKADGAREGIDDNEAITPFAVASGNLVDSNPPSGSVRINDIDAATASPNVVVKVLGRDDVSEVTAVRLSNDGGSWSSPQAYTGQESTAQPIGWNLIAPAYGGVDADGTKTVSVEFRDASGKWSGPETDTIELDRGGGTSTYSNAVLNDAAAGYWRLGESAGTTAADAAGANPGTFKGGALLDRSSLLPADPANGAVAFDGSNDYVAIPSSSALSAPAKVSVEAWIKPAALPASGNFASIASKPGSYALQFNGSRLEFTIIQSGSYRRLQAPVGEIQVGHSYYLAGTYDGTTQRLYVNGAEVASAARTGSVSTSGEELGIGAWTAGEKEFFDGTVDEVAIYSTALSAGHVAAHYEAGTEGTAPDLSVAAPTELRASAHSDTSVELHWRDNSDNEGEFRIERDTDPDFPDPVVAAVWADSTSFSDVDLEPDTTYYYRVRARNATDSSSYSNVAEVTTTPDSPGGDESGAAASRLDSSRYVAKVLGDGPVSYWRLDERKGNVASDARGRNPGRYRHGTRLGRTGLLATDRLDRAAGFDGRDDRVTVPDSRSLRRGRHLTIEAWIRPRRLPHRGRSAIVVAKLGSYSLGLEGRRLAFVLGVRGHRGWARSRAGLLAPGRVHHVAASFDGRLMRVYLDGAVVTRSHFSGRFTASHRLEIGSAARSGHFAGTIDEVAVYAKALSITRLRSHYRAGRPAKRRGARNRPRGVAWPRPNS